MRIELQPDTIDRNDSALPVKIGFPFDSMLKSTRMLGKHLTDTCKSETVSGNAPASRTTGDLERNDQIVRARAKSGPVPDATMIKSSAI